MHVKREIWTASDGSRARAWFIWSGNFETGTGHRGTLPVTLLRHWCHLRDNRKWARRGDGRA